MSKKEVVVISDTHVHPWKAFADGSGTNNTRLQRTLDVIRASLNEARDRDGIWIHAGDIIHSTGFVEHPVSSPLIDLLNEFPDVRKFFVWGNHDSRTQGGEISIEETFLYTIKQAVSEATVLDEAVHELEGGFRIAGFGAQNKIDIVENKVRNTLSEPADIAIYHQMVAGASFPSGMVTDHGMDPEFLRKHAHLSILGDIHKPHLDIDYDTAILIPGSPEQHNFGDKGDRGYWIVSFEKGGSGWIPVNFEDIDAGSPKFLTVESSEEVRDDGNYYRVLGGDDDEVPENATVLRSSPDVVETRDLLEDAHSQRDILGRWVDLNPPEGRFADQYIDVGLNILQRQDDIVPRDARIRRVEGENFFSYAKLAYDVKKGVHLIVGESDYYESNGSGKSSLLESLYWCLFGETTKGVSAADVIRWGETRCRVKVTIDLDGKELIVDRSRTQSSINLEVTLDGEEITAKTNTALSNKLEGILGWTPQLFKALGYFSQEDLVLLSQSTDAELKTILADLRGLSAYQDAADEAGELAREQESKVNKYSSKVNTLTEEIKRDEKRVAEQQKSFESWQKEHKERINALEKELNEAKRRKKAKKNEKEERVKKARNRAERLLEQAEDYTERLVSRKKSEYLTRITQEHQRTLDEKTAELEAVMESLDENHRDLEVDAIAELLKSLREKKSAIESDVRSLRQSEKTLQNRVKKAQAKCKELSNRVASIEQQPENKDKTCPTCGQVLSQDNSKQNVIQHIKEEYNEYSNELMECREELSEIEEEVDEKEAALEKTAQTVGRTKDLLTKLKKRDELQSSIKSIREKIDDAGETAVAYAEKDASEWMSQRRSRIKDRVSLIRTTLKNELNHAENAVDKISGKIDNEKNTDNPYEKAVEDTQESIEERKSGRWKAHRRAREADVQQAQYAYWQKAFGKSGIQSLLLEDIAALFNRHRGQIFPTLTRGKYDVQMSATSTTQKGEKRERAEYRVFQEGKEVPYEALSGGQRRRVDLGVLLTTTLAASKAHGVPGALGMLILDEVASYLDADGAEALAETLSEYCPEVVPSVFVVSQDMSHKALYDNVITVRQDENGISEVVT